MWLHKHQNYFMSFMLLLIGAVGAEAHDIGIAEASFHLEGENEFRLEVEVSQLNKHLITTPILPKSCQYHAAQPALIENGLAFEFQCMEQLKFADQLILPWGRSAVLLAIYQDGKALGSRLILKEDGLFLITLLEVGAALPSVFEQFHYYFKLGVEHILSGLDHLCFVLGVLLILRTRLHLIKAITAFTLGHSLTLFLAYLNYIQISGIAVEICIALSVVLLAYEALDKRENRASLTKTYPAIIAAMFGLLHGLGFAGALSELTIARESLFVALAGFNLGVEFGQILFIIIAILVFNLASSVFRKLQFTHLNQEMLKSAAAYSIGTVAMYWTLERSWILFGA